MWPVCEYVTDVTRPCRHETIMHNNYIMDLLPSQRERLRYWPWYVYKPINHCRNFHLLDRLSIRKRIELSAETNRAPNCHSEYIRGGEEASGQWVGLKSVGISQMLLESVLQPAHTHTHTRTYSFPLPLPRPHYTHEKGQTNGPGTLG